MSSHSSDTALAFDDQPYTSGPSAPRFGAQAPVLGSLFTGLQGPASPGELSGDGAVVGAAIIVLSAAVLAVCILPSCAV